MPTFEDFEKECDKIDEEMKKWNQKSYKNSLNEGNKKSLNRESVHIQ